MRRALALQQQEEIMWAHVNWGQKNYEPKNDKIDPNGETLPNHHPTQDGEAEQTAESPIIREARKVRTS